MHVVEVLVVDLLVVGILKSCLGLTSCEIITRAARNTHHQMSVIQCPHL